MATAPVDIPIQIKGLSDLEKLERRMTALEREVTRLQGKLPKTNRELEQTGKSSKSAAAGIRTIGAALKTVVLPLATLTASIGGFTAAVRTLSGQDFALAKVRSLGVDSKTLAENLKVVSAELQGNASVAELTAAAYDVASAGFTEAADAADVLKAASLGATGGFSDINTVADAATSVLNAYGRSARDAGILIDGFIQTQNDGKIVVDDYARNIGKVASAAAGLKIPIEEVNTVIAQSTAAGVQAEVAFTGLKGALARLASGEASKALKEFGIEIDAASLEADGLLGTLQKFKSLDTGAILKALGTEAGPALLPVINNLEKAEELLKNQENAAGAASRAQQEAANTISGAWNRVRVAFENLFSDQAALSQAIIPLLDAVAQSIDGITFALEQWRNIAREVNTAMTDIATTSGLVGQAFGQLGSAVKFAADQLARLVFRADGFESADASGYGRGGRNFGANYAQQEKELAAAAEEFRKRQAQANKTTPIPEFLTGGGSGSGSDELAKQREEMERMFEAGERIKQNLEREMELLSASTDMEKARLKIAYELEDTIANIVKTAAPGQREGLIMSAQELARIKDAQAIIDNSNFGEMSQWFDEQSAMIQDLSGEYMGLANGIASSMTGAFKSVIDGSKSADEAFKDMLGSMLDALLNYATQAIAQYIAIAIARSLAGMGGGGGGSLNLSAAETPMTSGLDFSSAFQFSGGGRPPQNMPSLVGENGPELFVPDQPGTVLSADDSRDAMNRWSDSDSAAAAGGPMNINVETTSINGMDFITPEQFKKGVDEAAMKGGKMGEQRAMNRLRQSRSTRQKVGI